MNPKNEQKIKAKKKINMIKIISAFLIVWFVFIGLSFAQDSWTEKIDDLAKITHFLVSFLSRCRALFAILAGKLMSNDLIYWSFMHLDVFLWKTWNIMKNFANYTLWFLFLYMVIKSIIDKDWANDIIKKKLTWFILAWVLIQASRFLIWAVVDISTIAVTAIWAIPGQIIQSDMSLQNNLSYMNALWWVSLAATWEVKTWIVMTFDPNKKISKDQQFITTEYKALDKPITQNNYLDMILPSYNTISWPLIFFGVSIFQFQDYSFSNPETKSSRKRLIEFALNLIIIIMYSLAMLALVIINFFRIFFLWIIIIFSPFIILLWVLGKMKILDTAKLKWLDKVSISNVFKLIFKPVVFMAYISIMMIFVIWARAILIPMNGWEVKLNDEITINSEPAWENYNSSIKAEWIFDFSINWAKRGIADLIVCFVTLFLMRFLIKIAVSSWSWIESLDKKLWEMTKTVEGIAWQIPIVPIGWWVWVNSVLGKDNSILEKMKDKKDGITSQMSADNQANLNKFMWIKDETPSYTTELQAILDKDKNNKNPNAFWEKSQAISKTVDWWLSLDTTEWQWVLENRRTKYKDSNVKIWNIELKQESDFEKFKTNNKDSINQILENK